MCAARVRSGLPISVTSRVDFRAWNRLTHRASRREETKRFLEAAYAALPDVARTYEVRRGLIIAYIDARSEEDFLEMRGVKLAIVAEMIKAQRGGAVSTSSNAGGWRRSISRLVSRWRRPVHQRFSAALRAACRNAGFRPSRSDIRDFVSSRNRLVHVGRFRSDPAAPQLPCRFSSPAMEYFFMVSFIDRFFLNLFGYTGPFLDWSRYPNHELGMI